MNGEVIFSEDTIPVGWSEADPIKLNYGQKGARLATLPRRWTPPFVLLPASMFGSGSRSGGQLLDLSETIVSRVRSLGGSTGNLIVRSSVAGESIWDRGSYKSVIVSSIADNFEHKLLSAAGEILASAPSKQVGLVIQRYLHPRSRGEFGNLLRVSKTRDQWELSTVTSDGTTSRNRFNTQRDEAASPDSGLAIKPGISRERLFGSVAAWLNNELLRGRPQRLSCEWVTDNHQVYLVQIDEEDEDFFGVNPFQIRVAPSHPPSAANGNFLAHAGGQALQTWDKLKVLEELWEPTALHKPTLFYVCLSDLPGDSEPDAVERLEDDFRLLIGSDNIVVRTSVRAGIEKP